MTTNIIFLGLQFIFILVLLFLHVRHHKRSKLYQHKLGKKIGDMEKNIEKLTNELVPYLDSLAKQRDKYKGELKKFTSKER